VTGAGCSGTSDRSAEVRHSTEVEINGACTHAATSAPPGSPGKSAPRCSADQRPFRVELPGRSVCWPSRRLRRWGHGVDHSWYARGSVV